MGQLLLFIAGGKDCISVPGVTVHMYINPYYGYADLAVWLMERRECWTFLGVVGILPKLPLYLYNRNSVVAL
jgi:hypothetical protein